MKKNTTIRPIDNYAELTEVSDSPLLKPRTLRVSILRFIPDEPAWPVPVARILTVATDATVASIY